MKKRVLLSIMLIALFEYILTSHISRAQAAAPTSSAIDGVLPAGLIRVKEEIGVANAEDVIAVDQWLYFRLGSQLWKSDGTVAGTVVVAADIFPFDMKACNGRLYFRHTDQLLSINPVDDSQQLIKDDFRGPWNDATVACSSTKLFFVDSDAKHGQELWQTTGKFAETSLVKDIQPGRNGSGIEKLMLFKDKIFFAAYTDQLGDALWMSDGTESRTQPLTTLAAPIKQFAATQEALYFQIDCCQLWHVNENFTSAELIEDFDKEGVTVLHLFPARTLLYLTTEQPIPDEVAFVQSTLWRSDGSATGTKQIYGYVRHNLTLATEVVGNRILFDKVEKAANGDNYGERQLLISDGTIITTTDIPFDLDYTRFYPHIALSQFPNQSILVYDRKLWRTDGTITNTVMLTNVSIGPHTLYPAQVTPFNNYFVYTQPTDHLSGIPLWISDGTITGTRLLVDFAPAIDEYGSINHVTDANGTLFFFVYDLQARHNGLWAYRAEAQPEKHELFLPLVGSK